MIFVTVGTTDFDDLIRTMDELAPSLGEEVVAQTGRGRYVPRNLTHFDLAPSLEPYYAQARLVVAHGGLGTAIEVLERGLKLIGISNPDRYDHHQDDILRTLSERGHLLWCRSLADLPAALAAAAQMRFTPYSAPPCRIAEVIRDYLVTGKVTKLSD
jgi:beta-1,4-N-acetylglucosaminyltransferase